MHLQDVRKFKFRVKIKFGSFISYAMYHCHIAHYDPVLT